MSRNTVGENLLLIKKDKGYITKNVRQKPVFLTQNAAMKDLVKKLNKWHRWGSSLLIEGSYHLN